MGNFKKALTVGGIADGYEWEFIDSGDDTATFRGEIYRRTGQEKDGAEVWAFDRRLTEAAGQATDLSGLLQPAKNQHPSNDGKVQVRPSDDGNQWELVVDGEVVRRTDARAITNAIDAMQWANACLPGGQAVDPASLNIAKGA